MRTLLIDGDILVVSTCAAAETEVDWGDDQWTITSDIKSVKATILDAIENIKKDLEAQEAIITLSLGTTFRHEIFEPYKKGRGRKPVGTGEVKRWLIEEQGAKLKPGIEADDTMGILSTHPRLIKGEKVIVSADKDMMTIPGLLYRDGEIITVTEEEADRNWLTQTLTGDVTDNYPGLKGYGAKKAEKFLDGIPEGEDPWPHIVQLFVDNGFDEEYALTQARMARILRWTDYDYKKKEVKLWRPS
ncbi:hypothetical protein [Brucella pseudogrignonensis]|uniref:hypothetical protein n=1 Tax=Brucella pseudogrignonensis TaxID=419475 RepID=UPI000CFBB5C7|nr:hypothetical protein [Brucella pseudogrignonensis]MQP38741.1 hypothetical protein [Ochrobactrum sp. MYb237]PQZ43356.1 hypothetical protein CQ059_05340 [Brucella pseudogrignonensis]PRA43103.1 hypothetical protein CQ063_01825 [Brucella pseudogrignonensis]PRA72427.1 hypothetical protein CQ055_03755 [Brucella pseudogrignonensis]